MNANLRLLARGEPGGALRQDAPVRVRQRPRALRRRRARCRPARTPVAFDAGGLRVGLSVCYDLRFPELYRALMQPPCDLISVPSAFTYTTGAAHWEVLLRARAIENQCYVVAARRAARTRTAGAPSATAWSSTRGARSSPAAARRAKASSSPSSSRERIAGVRRQLPALEHRLEF